MDDRTTAGQVRGRNSCSQNMASNTMTLPPMSLAFLTSETSSEGANLRSTDFTSELDGSERQPTILILDDLDINRRLLRAMLKTAPYRVLEAKRATEAL